MHMQSWSRWHSTLQPTWWWWYTAASTNRPEAGITNLSREMHWSLEAHFKSRLECKERTEPAVGMDNHMRWTTMALFQPNKTLQWTSRCNSSIISRPILLIIDTIKENNVTTTTTTSIRYCRPHHARAFPLTISQLNFCMAQAAFTSWTSCVAGAFVEANSLISKIVSANEDMVGIRVSGKDKR